MPDTEKNKQDQKEQNKDAAVKPEVETLHTTDPQEHMEGPVSSFMQGIKKDVDKGAETKKEADKKKEARPKEREIFNWVNPQTKEVKLPGDLSAALKKKKNESSFFDSLSFTNKKEYIEWIVTAKREETRTERVKGSIERLGKQWKNPRNS